MMRWVDFDQLIPWIFERNGERISLEPEPRLIVDDSEYLTRAVVEGAGLGRISADFAAPFLRRRELLSLLPEWAPYDNGLNLVWNRSVPVRPPFNALLRYFKSIRFSGDGGNAQSAV
jgi:DNA-binding transcriptional LysR family regulator